MAKPSRLPALPTQEVPVAKQPTDETPDQAKPEPFSFLRMADQSAAEIPTKVSDAKQAILTMIPKQKGYLDAFEAGRELPKTKGGDRTVATWFTQNRGEPYWTNIRWGQRSLTISGVKAWRFLSAEKLHAFYDAVEKAIRAGELDAIIEAEANKNAPKDQAPELKEAAE